MALITVDQLKEHLGVTDASQDSYLQSLANRVSAYIERYTGRVFGRTVTVTDEVADYPNTGTLLLGNTDVTAVSSVKLNDVVMDAGAYKWNSAGEINLPAPGRWDLNWSSVPSGNNSIKVTYTYGVPSVPLDLELAALEIAAAVHARRKGQGQKVAERIGDYSVQYADAAKAISSMPDQLGILDSYRFVRV